MWETSCILLGWKCRSVAFAQWWMITCLLISVVDGGWSEWCSFTRCTVSCGGGVRIRNRTCTNPPPEGDGLDCVGPSAELQICNNQSCRKYQEISLSLCRTTWLIWKSKLLNDVFIVFCFLSLSHVITTLKGCSYKQCFNSALQIQISWLFQKKLLLRFFSFAKKRQWWSAISCVICVILCCFTIFILASFIWPLRCNVYAL